MRAIYLAASFERQADAVYPDWTSFKATLLDPDKDSER